MGPLPTLTGGADIGRAFYPASDDDRFALRQFIDTALLVQALATPTPSDPS